MSQLRDNYKSTYISTATTTDASGNGTVAFTGVLVRVVVTETSAGAITIYDAVSGQTTTTIAVLKGSIAEGSYDFGISISKGIQVVTAGNSKVTVVYAKVQ